MHKHSICFSSLTGIVIIMTIIITTSITTLIVTFILIITSSLAPPYHFNTRKVLLESPHKSRLCFYRYWRLKIKTIFYYKLVIFGVEYLVRIILDSVSVCYFKELSLKVLLSKTLVCVIVNECEAFGNCKTFKLHYQISHYK